jgi:hypothetical protein
LGHFSRNLGAGALGQFAQFGQRVFGGNAVGAAEGDSNQNRAFAFGFGGL